MKGVCSFVSFHLLKMLSCLSNLPFKFNRAFQKLHSLTCAGRYVQACPDSDPTSYDALEKPLMRKNPSFANLVSDLSNHVSPDTSQRGTRGGGAATINRVSSRGTLLGSREPSARGGNAFGKPLSEAVASAEVAAALHNLEKAE